MAVGVGQAFLRDAVDDQRRGGVDIVGDGIQVAGNGQAGALADLARQCRKRGGQAELIQTGGAQSADECSELVEAAAHDLAGGPSLLTDVGVCVIGEAVERQQQSGELLSNLVMQFGGDPAAVVLLGYQQPRAAGTPLTLQAVGHRVEAHGERTELLVIVDVQP